MVASWWQSTVAACGHWSKCLLARPHALIHTDSFLASRRGSLFAVVVLFRVAKI